MSTTAAELRHLPLFSALTDEQLEQLHASLTTRKVKKGETLFREGDRPEQLSLLVDGEIQLTEANEPQLLLRPLAPIGELGALTGLPRNTTAVATADSELLEIRTAALTDLFARSSELAAAFYRALLGVVSEKVRRDKLRVDDMRGNIIRTQKAMKELRELVLASEETPLSQPLCDKLDELIEHNRRSHYRVEPVEGHSAKVRVSSGHEIEVTELSEGYLKLARDARLEPGSEWTMVLVLPAREIPVSGKVERLGDDGALFKLDPLIEEYRAALLGYLTQLQLLDLVV